MWWCWSVTCLLQADEKAVAVVDLTKEVLHAMLYVWDLGVVVVCGFGCVGRGCGSGCGKCKMMVVNMVAVVMVVAIGLMAVGFVACSLRRHCVLDRGYRWYNRTAWWRRSRRRNVGDDGWW